MSEYTDQQILSLSPKDFERLVDVWVRNKAASLDSGAAVRLVNTLSTVVIAAQQHEMDELKEHAIAAEAMAMFLSSNKKPDYKMATMQLEKFKHRAFLSWDWYFKQ
jgi:hypothetical protein